MPPGHRTLSTPSSIRPPPDPAGQRRATARAAARHRTAAPDEQKNRSAPPKSPFSPAMSCPESLGAHSGQPDSPQAQSRGQNKEWSCKNMACKRKGPPSGLCSALTDCYIREAEQENDARCRKTRCNTAVAAEFTTHHPDGKRCGPESDNADADEWPISAGAPLDERRCSRYFVVTGKCVRLYQ